ncbi:MAG: Rrf2 family transcriptional regulator [Thiofilum sp.]|uniref:RrF2 family transcriptional regulator n=1 Tax=Thiofilum sp. TaxID=2212733 RepID=UPI0025D327D8|nr:Rrf2 family transcriptional regulator [Thiofilum sp.]MBK8454550.1 Rrf2 family transcriptional regulator [Thiofilum sp.]
MTLSEQSWNAIMSMVLLANHDQPQALRLKDLQAHLGVSRPQMELIMARLREAGLVEGIRGTGGGYYLKRAAYRINLADIVNAVEEPEQHFAWLSQGTESERALAQQVWQELNGKLNTLLAGMSLAVLAHQEKPRLKPRMGQTANMIANMFPAHHASLVLERDHMLA